MTAAANLTSCFAHLSEERLFRGACFVEPRAYDFPNWIEFQLGRCAYIMRRDRSSLHEYDVRDIALRGYELERVECISATEALRRAAQRGD